MTFPNVVIHGRGLSTTEQAGRREGARPAGGGSGFPARAIIGGETVPGRPDRVHERRDILSGAVVTRAAALDAAESEHAADAASTAIADAVGERPAPGGPAGTRSSPIRRPAGVVPGIAPWNAAVALAVRAVAAPLAPGNTVVPKGSELCPKLHGTVARNVIDAGLPEGVPTSCRTRRRRRMASSRR